MSRTNLPFKGKNINILFNYNLFTDIPIDISLLYFYLFVFIFNLIFFLLTLLNIFHIKFLLIPIDISNF